MRSMFYYGLAGLAIVLLASVAVYRNGRFPRRGADPTAASAASANPLGGCATCHTDVTDAFATSEHHKRKMRCEDCHGPSLKHIDDENNEVKPDRTFGRKDVDPFCRKCHECTRPGAAAGSTRPASEHKTCTECHEAHRTVMPAQQAGGRAGRNP
jgi:hypothetical protein